MSQTAIPVPTEHKIVYLQNITAWANKNHPYLVNAKLKFAALIPPSMVCCACFVADLKGRTLWHGHVVGGALCLHIPALVSWQRGHKTGGKNSGAALGRYFTRRHPWLGHSSPALSRYNVASHPANNIYKVFLVLFLYDTVGCIAAVLARKYGQQDSSNLELVKCLMCQTVNNCLQLQH